MSEPRGAQSMCPSVTAIHDASRRVRLRFLFGRHAGSTELEAPSSRCESESGSGTRRRSACFVHRCGAPNSGSITHTSFKADATLERSDERPVIGSASLHAYADTIRVCPDKAGVSTHMGRRKHQRRTPGNETVQVRSRKCIHQDGRLGRYRGGPCVAARWRGTRRNQGSLL
jgi:hypothetical protein